MESTDSKELPLFSPVNLLITGLAIAVLVVIFFVAGNQIFNPGDLSTSSTALTADSEFLSHADFESKCQLCHQSLQSKQADLCVECHTRVGSQMTSGSGLHGQISNAAECRLCHPDHRGRDFDMVEYARSTFDHAATGFILGDRHANVGCQDCHTPESKQTSANCESCHEEPPIHAGVFPEDCGQCHEGSNWQNATWQGQPYDHELVGFSLALHQSDYSGNPLACQNCHKAASSSTPEFACQECHTSQDAQFMEGHVLAFGQTCMECHDGVDRMVDFDHASVFPLEGKHMDLICAKCHTGQTFNAPQTVCATCHEEPEIHAGFFGLRCQMCHTADAWQPARLASHDFPFDHGGQGDWTCTTCHTGAYTEYTCYTCHDHKEDQMQAIHKRAGIESEQIPECAACHLDGLVHTLP